MELNDLEQAAIAQFMSFDTMREAVKKVLLTGIYEHVYGPGEAVDPMKNRALWFVSNNPSLTDEVIGQNNRALYQGLNALQVGFDKLAEYKKVDSTAEPTKKNKAR